MKYPNNRFIIFSFSSVKNGEAFAASLLGFHIGEIAKTDIETICFASAVTGVNPVNIQPVYTLFHKVIKGLTNRLFKLTSPSGARLRYLQERFYDHAASRKIKTNDIVLVINPPVYKTLRKNKQKHGINVYLPGNPSDTFILQKMRQLRNFADISFSDVYTSPKRQVAFAKFIEQTDYIICLNTLIRKSFEATYPQKKLIPVMGYFMPSFGGLKASYKKSDTVFRVSYLGYTVFLKGLHTLLEAWRMLNLANARLTIGGEIDENYKKTIANELLNLPNVDYQGFVNDKNIFYRNSSVFACPSIIDACPGTIFEAMHCGIPVIASDGCGNSEVIEDGKEGFVFPAGDVGQLAEKIQYLYDNQHLLPEMGKNAAIRVSCLKSPETLALEINAAILTDEIVPVSL